MAAHRDERRPLEGHEHRAVGLLSGGAHGDDAMVRPRRRFALADHLGLGVDRVAGEDRRGEPYLVPAEIGDGLLAHVRDAHAGDDGERQARVHQRAAELGGRAVRGIDVQRMLVHGEEREPGVVGLAERAARPVLVDVADLELLVIAPRRFAIALWSHFLCAAYHKRISSMKFRDLLTDIVGAGNVLTAAEDTKPYFTDWRKQYAAAADCVVRPASTGEVSRVVALCVGENVAVVPQGGNTGLVGGSVPTGARREIVLSLSRMNRIRGLDALNDTITVEAGCVLAAVQRAADEAARFFPLSLAAEGSCQIGGNLPTNAGGVNVLRYGMARDQVLGLEVVLPDGQVWGGLRGLRKDNTGYDLKQLFLGAEGTLGIITAAVLRLHPKPAASATAWIALHDPRRAVELLAALRERLGERLSAFELISRACLEAVPSPVKDLQDPLPAA